MPARALEEGLVLSKGGAFSIAQPEIQISLVRATLKALAFDQALHSHLLQIVFDARR
jgi:hypothetical protein